MSPSSSPLVLVQKNDKSWRVCVDYRKPYAQTIQDAYPFPMIADNLASWAGSNGLLRLIKHAYHQTPTTEKKTAFATQWGGLYQYRVLPFGLWNAPATFKRTIERTFQGLQWHITVLYLDNIIVIGHDFFDHLNNSAKSLRDFYKPNLN